LTYDRWNSNTLINKIDETMSNIILFPFDQSLKKMAIPTKEYEKFIYEDKIIDENPVMKWMISNAVVKPDINNNYKPMKEYLSSTKRIDGVISSIMALDRCKANEADIITKDFKDILMLF
jgi:phage terminase large subunit-like protein